MESFLKTMVKKCSMVEKVTHNICLLLHTPNQTRPPAMGGAPSWPCPGHTAEVHMSSPARWGEVGMVGGRQLPPTPHHSVTKPRQSNKHGHTGHPGYKVGHPLRLMVQLDQMTAKTTWLLMSANWYAMQGAPYNKHCKAHPIVGECMPWHAKEGIRIQMLC